MIIYKCTTIWIQFLLKLVKYECYDQVIRVESLLLELTFLFEK